MEDFEKKTDSDRVESDNNMEFYTKLDNVTRSKGYRCYSTNRKLGKVIYDPNRLNEHAVTYIYILHVNKWKL